MYLSYILCLVLVTGQDVIASSSVAGPTSAGQESLVHPLMRRQIPQGYDQFASPSQEFLSPDVAEQQAAMPRAAPSIPVPQKQKKHSIEFDCSEGVAGWSPIKRRWCCQIKSIFCEDDRVPQNGMPILADTSQKKMAEGRQKRPYHVHHHHYVHVHHHYYGGAQAPPPGMDGGYSTYPNSPPELPPDVHFDCIVDWYNCALAWSDIKAEYCYQQGQYCPGWNTYNPQSVFHPPPAQPDTYGGYGAQAMHVRGTYMCEGHKWDQGECHVPGCCEWKDGQCQSAVGSAYCDDTPQDRTDGPLIVPPVPKYPIIPEEEEVPPVNPETEITDPPVPVPTPAPTPDETVVSVPTPSAESFQTIAANTQASSMSLHTPAPGPHPWGSGSSGEAAPSTPTPAPDSGSGPLGNVVLPILSAFLGMCTWSGHHSF